MKIKIGIQLICNRIKWKKEWKDKTRFVGDTQLLCVNRSFIYDNESRLVSFFQYAIQLFARGDKSLMTDE